MRVLASSLSDTDPFSKAPLNLSDQEVFHHEASRLGFPHLPLSSSLGSAPAWWLLHTAMQQRYTRARHQSLIDTSKLAKGDLGSVHVGALKTKTK